MLDNQNEDRNCCTNENNFNKNIPTYSFSFSNNLSDNTCEKIKETKEDMLSKIQCLKFAIVELSEYLDTHEDDKKAIFIHNKYANELESLKEKYQKMFGPLTIYFPCNKWRWIEEPWPWEGGNN